MMSVVGRVFLAFLLVVVAVSEAGAQRLDLAVDAPPALEAVARRIRAFDAAPLAASLAGAGLTLPERARIVLLSGDDPRVARVPRWIVGLASGSQDIVIFPERIGGYPYGSIESVVRHEIVHLALDVRAAGRPLPRWFHEGVAVTVESGWNGRDEMHLLLAAFERPSMADLSRLFASDRYPETSQAYLLAAALVDDVRKRHGPGVPGSIAGAVAAGQPFHAAFLAVTGEQAEDVAARAWAGHRRLTRVIPIVTSPTAVWTLILALAGLAFVLTVRRRRAQRHAWEQEEMEVPEPGSGESWPEPDRESPPDVR